MDQWNYPRSAQQAGNQAIMGEERRQEMMQNLFGEDQSEDEVDSEQEAVRQSAYVSDEGEGEAEGQADLEGEGEVEAESEGERADTEPEGEESEGKIVRSSPERDISDQRVESEGKEAESDAEGYGAREATSRRQAISLSVSERSHEQKDLEDEDGEVEQVRELSDQGDGHHVSRSAADMRDVFGYSDEEEQPEYAAQHSPQQSAGEDVKLMYEMGLDAYRFSISWPRLIPEGRGAINPKGVEYYNSLINELLDHGIRPYITLHHFDLPKSLEDSYGGWVNPQIVEDYLAFADICFREFGDRVKNWITFNEPNIFASLGYDRGIIAPKRCSIPAGRCKTGNSTIEPYLAGHYMLLSHAAAVKLYRDKYQAKQKGSIGLIILSQWYRSLTNTIQDITATQRMTDFEIGWFLDPLIYGDYPKVMRQIVGSRLPLLTEKQSREIRQSFDFIGLNHYSTNYVEDAPAAHANNYERDYFTDLSVRVTVERDGIPIGQMSKIKGFGSVPWGFQELLEYIRQHYGNPPVVVTECGYPDLSNDSIPVAEALNDTNRINYYHDYLQYMLAAIRNGSNTRGFFVWTLLDDFEYVMGYTARFGLHYVDFSDNLKRYPKLSVRGFKRMLLPKTNLLVL